MGNTNVNAFFWPAVTSFWGLVLPLVPNLRQQIINILFIIVSALCPKPIQGKLLETIANFQKYIMSVWSMCSSYNKKLHKCKSANFQINKNTETYHNIHYHYTSDTSTQIQHCNPSLNVCAYEFRIRAFNPGNICLGHTARMARMAISCTA